MFCRLAGGGWRRLEDRDEPITAERDVELEIAEAKGAVDRQDEDPEPVARWLAEQGVEIYLSGTRRPSTSTGPAPAPSPRRPFRTASEAICLARLAASSGSKPSAR